MTEVLDVVKLSDEFRQKGAKIDPPMGYIVGLGRQFAVSSTYLRGEYKSDNWTNDGALRAMMIPAREIVQFAAMNKIEKVVLPFDNKSPLAKWVREKVCKPLSKEFELSVVCNPKAFKPDYNGADVTIRTCLDEGIRGMVGVVPPWGVGALPTRKVA